MEQLGCFAGSESPQSIYLPHFEQRRSVGVEVRKQIRTVKKQIAAFRKSVHALQVLDCELYKYERLIDALSLLLETLERVKAASSKHFGGPYDREILSIVEAQEFVRRRTELLGSRVLLSPAAVADIFDLNERGLTRPSSRDIVGRVQKALLRFRRGEDYDKYMSVMEELIRDWRLPVPRQYADKQTEKRTADCHFPLPAEFAMFSSEARKGCLDNLKH